ncbi:hypothetical protein E8E13_009570 [Curvularia kusanoi]|uniref:VOC domain-containing protein n=1 Tax=Curvularia kusanoi TaxID=90978 RepID=A0A9P4WA46_CURKU|nr:hypothetical protein E8E13_009570 [Curvularia kusanoi]
MPVSHFGLTVSHLPASSSFFLSALQPLGYRYIGQQGHQVGFGIREADFFLSQETPGIRAGAAHVAFTATSRTAVREFYSAALNAGGRPNGSPACRTDDDTHFNAAVLDLDGNSIEVVYSGAPDYMEDGTVISHSRVITWERTVTQSMRDDASVISSRTAKSVAKAPTEVSKAPSVASKAPSVVSQAPSVARSHSEPAAVPQAAPPASSGGDAAKTLVGTLLGAAAGAAVAYAFVRSERDSAKKESEFSAFMEAKNTVKTAVSQIAQTSPPPQPPMSDPPPMYEPAPSVARSVHRNDDAGSVVSATPSRASQMPSVRGQKQIEAAPASYYAPPPSDVSLTRSNTQPLQIEYAPARSVAGSDMRSRFSASRSMTSPEIRTIEAARSVASVSSSRPESRAPSRPQSVAHSTAPSSLISSFVPDNVSRKAPEGSVYSHTSSRSKAKSSHTHASRHSSHSRHTSSRDREDSPPPASEAPSKKPSKAASVISSIFKRDKKSSADSDFIDDLDIEEASSDDYETVVPSDSISQVGGSRRTHRRKHRSRTEQLREEAGTTVSKSSHRSHRSHRSHKSRSHHDDSGSESDSDHSTESRRRHRSSRPTVVSEPSDVSTIKPAKHSSSSRDKERRKDSVTEGSKYDDLFDQVQYGHGSVPVRGITPSMINASTDNKNRSVISFAMAQRTKAFER